LYVDLDPSTAPTPADAETRFRSLVIQLEKDASSAQFDHQGKVAFESDVGRIRDWWDSEFERDGSRGVAVFASARDNLWRTMPLAQTVVDRACLAPDLCVVPLVPLVGRDDGALVAFVSRERGQVFRLTGGRLAEVVDESEEQPGQHDQGGWSQARYQRHIEKLVMDHLKAVGGELDKRVRSSGGPQLVVVAPEELRGDFEAALSNETRAAIVGWAQAEAHAAPADLLEIARPLLDHARAARERETIERWREELGRGGRAAAGWPQTLEAASDERVEQLLVDGRRDRQAYQCPQCGRAVAEAGSCPLDGATLEPRPDGVDLAAHQVLMSGGTVVSVASDDLADHQGIGALLRF
jgi:peptide chain release factor subunit 1